MISVNRNAVLLAALGAAFMGPQEYTPHVVRSVSPSKLNSGTRKQLRAKRKKQRQAKKRSQP